MSIFTRNWSDWRCAETLRRCSPYNIVDDHEAGSKQHKVRDRVPPVSCKCARRSTIRYTTAVECEPKNNWGNLEHRQDNIVKCRGKLREPLSAKPPLPKSSIESCYAESNHKIRPWDWDRSYGYSSWRFKAMMSLLPQSTAVFRDPSVVERCALSLHRCQKKKRRCVPVRRVGKGA